MSVDSYNQYLDPYVKPIIQKGKETYNNTQQSINESENENVKYMRGIILF